MNIIDAIKDPDLGFRNYLGPLRSWAAWLCALRVLWGLPISRKYYPLIRQCTGRDPTKLPPEGFQSSLFLTGRRSGKSRIAAVIAAYEAVLAGHHEKLAAGEMGMVCVLSPTKWQSRIVKKYIRAIFDQTDILHNEINRDTRDGFDLKNGISIEILAGDWRTIRGYTLVAAVIDEAAFFGLDSESKVKSDTELIRAVKPSLSSIEGRLIAISSPYAKRGWCYQTHQRNWANDLGSTLVWNCPSRTMNPNLSQKIVEEALQEDMAAAKAEYLGEFRDDVAIFLPREIIERCVQSGQFELLPRLGTHYVAFADLSGGRGDDATLAVAHREDRQVVVDSLRRWKPPFNPQAVIAEMVQHLKRYNIKRVVGDNYAAEFVSQAFQSRGIRYRKSDKNKSELYLELLPRLCSQEIELPDDDHLIKQLSSLERRTRSGGRDSIDHPPGAHDDLANVIAGVADVCSGKNTVVGALGAT